MGRSKINQRGEIQLGRGSSSNKALQDQVDQFLAALKARKYSPQSISKRRDNLRKFLLYLQGSGIERLQDVDLQRIEKYRLCLIDHEYSEVGIESDLRAVRLFFKHMEEQGVLFENPATKLKIRKTRVCLGVVLSEREVLQLLSVPDTTRPQGLRDRAILEVLYSTAMRRGELVGLALHDVDLDRATVRIVKGKGRKQRLVPLGKHAVEFLRLYLQNARPRYMPKFEPVCDALWLDRHRKRIGHEAVANIIRRCARVAGLSKTVDTHTFRRTCATHMLQGGAHPVMVAELLGHANLCSLSHYLRTTIGDLKKAHSRTKPGR